MPEYSLPTLIMVGISAVVCLLVLFRLVKDRLAPVKTVNAKVVDKGKEKRFSKAGAYGKSERCYVVFRAEGKKLSFYVSEFSYNGYRKGETGKLTYKGRRLIDFQ